MIGIEEEARVGRTELQALKETAKTMAEVERELRDLLRSHPQYAAVLVRSSKTSRKNRLSRAPSRSNGTTRLGLSRFLFETGILQR